MRVSGAVSDLVAHLALSACNGTKTVWRESA